MTDDSIGAAVRWVDQLMLGQIGVAMAVLAISFLGFRMLEGYSNPREMIRVLIGCFILFGASTIAGALVRTSDNRYTNESYGDVGSFDAEVLTPQLLAPKMPPVSVNPFDPYVGASPQTH